MEAKKIKKSAKLLYLGFQELVNTEEKYINDMNVLITSIIRPLQNNFDQGFSDSKIPKVPTIGIHSIFGNLEQLVGVNRAFLFDLKKIYLPSTTTTCTTTTASSNTVVDYPDHIEMEKVWCQVASLIRQTWPFFRAYKTYSARHGNRDMSMWYDKCKGLEQWINRALSSTASLEAELIKPIQRILKYSLFVRDALKSTRSPDSLEQMEDAMSSVDAMSSEVNASLLQNEKDQKMINLWNMLGKQPDHFLQPGRALLQIYVAEVSPAILQSNGGYSWGKRKEYLVCVLSDIILFARPNKAGLFGNSRVESTAKVVALTGPAGTTESTHHAKMITRMTDVNVTETYAATQARGDCGFELRVLGTIDAKDMEAGYSPYNAYAIWCQSIEAKDKLAQSIRNALSAKLAAFFSRKKINIPGKK